MKLLDTIYESVLLEYSHKLINQLVDKFSEEGVNPEESSEYINLFHRYSQGLDLDKRDITKYSWDELYRTVNSKNKNRRVKAGKIGDKNVDKDDIIYNNDGVRIYRGDSQEKCVRYGNGYNFCISSRGDDNKYRVYTSLNKKKTFYFVFNDNLPPEDENHILVIIFAHDDHYKVWNALNKGGKLFITYDNMVEQYPWLEGLEYLFV
jgi:hypothetical protein